MASKYTSGYQLSQWETGDKVLRTDFNEDNAKIDAALRKHDGQLLGVPALGRNLYNFFLRQKNAGQDVSWMEGLVYDDFSDQSKIESMGDGMSWSPTEKCILFNPADDQFAAQLVTKTYELDRRYTYAFLWVRNSLAQDPVVEIRLSSSEKWIKFDKLSIFNYWSTNAAGEKSVETSYFLPQALSLSRFQIRLTLTAVNSASFWPVKLYDYGCMLV